MDACKTTCGKIASALVAAIARGLFLQTVAPVLPD